MLGCSAAALPPATDIRNDADISDIHDVTELARSSAKVASALDAAHHHTQRLLDNASVGSLDCPGAEDALLTASECFTQIFAPRIQAVRGIAEYAATLAEIVAVTRDFNNDASPLISAGDELLARLSLEDIPAPIRREAGAALAAWERDGRASTIRKALTELDPQVQAVSKAVVQELDEVRTFIYAVQNKLALDLLLFHDEELTLRRALELRRHELAALVSEGEDEDAPGMQVATIAELTAINDALAGLPRREEILAGARVDQAVAVIDAAESGLVEWSRAHHRLGIALATGRSPHFYLLTQAAAAVELAARRLTSAVDK